MGDICISGWYTTGCNRLPDEPQHVAAVAAASSLLQPLPCCCSNVLPVEWLKRQGADSSMFFAVTGSKLGLHHGTVFTYRNGEQTMLQ
jgi:hypothetical protein